MRYNGCVTKGTLSHERSKELNAKNVPQLLMIMSSSIGYLTARSTFLQVSPDIPITKSRHPDKFDSPEVFEGERVCLCSPSPTPTPVPCSVSPCLVRHPYSIALRSHSMIRSIPFVFSKQARTRRRLDHQSETNRSAHPVSPRPRTRGNTGKSVRPLSIPSPSPFPSRSFPSPPFFFSTSGLIRNHLCAYHVTLAIVCVVFSFFFFFAFFAGTSPRSIGDRHDRGKRRIHPSSRSRKSVIGLSVTCSSVSLNRPPRETPSSILRGLAHVAG